MEIGLDILGRFKEVGRMWPQWVISEGRIRESEVPRVEWIIRYLLGVLKGNCCSVFSVYARYSKVRSEWAVMMVTQEEDGGVVAMERVNEAFRSKIEDGSWVQRRVDRGNEEEHVRLEIEWGSGNGREWMHSYKVRYLNGKEFILEWNDKLDMKQYDLYGDELSKVGRSPLSLLEASLKFWVYKIGKVISY
jgi:hypothetical protein